MFSPVDLELTGWASSASSLSPLGALEHCSVETERTLPVNNLPLPGVSSPFIVIPLVAFTHENIMSTESKK